MRSFLCLLALTLLGTEAAAAPVVIWQEGEQPTRQQIEPNAGMQMTNPAELSGGAWLASWAHPGHPNGVLEYDITIPTDGPWHLWLRADGGTGLAYRVDGGAWQDINIKAGQQTQFIAADGWGFWPPPVAWFDLGTQPYTAGKHTIAFRLGGGDVTKDRHAGIDCFVLTDGPFTPHGKYQPGEQEPAPQTFHKGDTWNFNPPPDQLSPAAEFDLRYLNEKVAGEHGFIRLGPDGNGLVRGDGQPIRFWAVCADPHAPDSLDSIKNAAQTVAKRGVNLARIFAALQPTAPGSKVTDVNEASIDAIFKMEAALKSAGIYCTISPYWPTSIQVQPSWGVNPGGSQKADALLYIDPALQKGYRAWMKALLTRVNPYTGLTLANDPAVAVIEIQNEDDLLWWGIAGVSGPDFDLLRSKYADFLTQKYGSLDKARQAWNYNPKPGEIAHPADWAKGIPPLLHIWDFTADGYAKKSPWPGFIACSSDQLEFFARLEYQFNTDIVGYLKKDLGCKQLVNTGNWQAADIKLMQDTENWCNTPGDVIAFHDYFGGVHNGSQAGWRFNVGDYYTDLSATKVPQQLPTNHKQPAGRAYMVTETTWTAPDLYQSEGPLMIAGQESLNGMAGCFWSTVGIGGWNSGGAYKWSWNTPELMGQFPAAALIYRTNMLRAEAPAVVEHRRLADLWARKTPVIYEGTGWDPNRDSANMVQTTTIKTSVDPLALVVGGVRVVYDDHPEQTTVIDLSHDLDRAHDTVRSDTGQIEDNYKLGLYSVNAPQAQGVAGFLQAAGPQKLSDVAIDCHNAYATIVAVALDGQPLATSKRVLIQVGTTARPTGWTVRPTAVLNHQGVQTPAFEVLSYGDSPAQVENAHATVTIANPDLRKATLLDINGLPTPTAVAVQSDGKALTVTLPPDAMYVVVTP